MTLKLHGPRAAISHEDRKSLSRSEDHVQSLLFDQKSGQQLLESKEYVDKKLLKQAYELIKKNNLREEFPEVYQMGKEISLKKLAEQGCWDIAEMRAKSDSKLLEYLVYLAMEFEDLFVANPEALVIFNQRQNLRYEYQPVGSNNNNSSRSSNLDAPADGSGNAALRYKERGSGQSRRGCGNFYGHQ
ncbi:hypothetical protein L6452_30824 [Arctium lappa]|uniref:Uncharacterized protein n=1 Tax=Arctium lappa TaxID=4217 RepID=A0ACB8ZIU0_ARCLA|nr:hypothetical protein L6452_30824 [Arctium lappa]